MHRQPTEQQWHTGAEKGGRDWGCPAGTAAEGKTLPDIRKASHGASETFSQAQFCSGRV